MFFVTTCFLKDESEALGDTTLKDESEALGDTTLKDDNKYSSEPSVSLCGDSLSYALVSDRHLVV
jgi:hypothetical protein